MENSGTATAVPAVPKAAPLILICTINSNKYFNIKAIIGLDICSALPLFYDLSGCDIVSSLYDGKGICKIFDIWLNSEQKKALTEFFIQLGKTPTSITERHMDDLEAYILEIYGFLATTLATGLYGNFNESANNDLCSLTHSYSG